jgi:hypothetical protein
VRSQRTRPWSPGFSHPSWSPGEARGFPGVGREGAGIPLAPPPRPVSNDIGGEGEGRRGAGSARPCDAGRASRGAAVFLLGSRAVMATPNNLTPTNCSWWPISALESDAAKPAEAPDAPEAASPAHWPKESLVLYHWTQSFSSQKVGSRGGLGEGSQGWGPGPERLEGARGCRQGSRPMSSEVTDRPYLGPRAQSPMPGTAMLPLSFPRDPCIGGLRRDKGKGQQALPASGLLGLLRWQEKPPWGSASLPLLSSTLQAPGQSSGSLCPGLDLPFPGAWDLCPSRHPPPPHLQPLRAVFCF